MPALNGLYHALLRTSDLTSSSGLANAPGGIVAAVDGTAGTGVIQLPSAIDPTKPWRLAVLVQVNDGNRTHISLQNPNKSQSGFTWDFLGTGGVAGYGASGSHGGSGPSAQYTFGYTGATGGIPAGTWIWAEVASDGNFVWPCVIPATYSTINTLPVYNNPWDGSQYCGEQQSNYIDSTYGASYTGLQTITFTQASTKNVIAGIYFSQGRLDGPTDGKLSPPMWLNVRVLQDSTILNSPATPIFIPGTYGQPGGTPMVLYHHTLGYYKIHSEAFPTIASLINDGYAVVAPDTMPIAVWPDATNSLTSNWGAPAGLLWRKAAVDWVRANLPATWQLYHFGLSMGGINAFNYEKLWPGSAAILTVSGVASLTGAYRQAGTPYIVSIDHAFGSWYVATAANTGQDPTTAATYWQQVAPVTAAPPAAFLQYPNHNFEGFWLPDPNYAAGQVVNAAYLGTIGGLAAWDPTLNPATYLNVPVYMSQCTSAWASPPGFDGGIFATQATNFQAAVNAAGGNVTVNLNSNGTCGHATPDLFYPDKFVAFFDKYRRSIATGQSGTGTSSKTATTTGLTVASGGATVTAIASGSAITLTATVSTKNGAVNAGQVNFCDADAAPCAGVHLAGSAQLTGSGTATLRLGPGIGVHKYTAAFSGTGAYAPSSSSASALTVTGAYPTATTIAASGSAGNYALAATVSSIGGTIAPGGTVQFVDTFNGNSLLGTAVLGQAGKSALSWLAHATPIPGSGPGSVVTGDFKGDGKLDLAEANSASNTVSVLLGNGDGTFTTIPAAATGKEPVALTAGDFNRDGNLDLAVANYADNNVTILLGKGDGTFTPAAASPKTGMHPTALAAADLNLDGKLDLAVANSGNNTITILFGNGDGTFTPATVAPATGSYPNSIAVRDLNGDGIPDLAVTNGNDNTVTVLRGNGDGTFTAAANAATGTQPVWVAAGDFNADGIADLAVANSNSNSITILLGNGDATFTAAPALSTGANPEAVAVGDLNQDGLEDLAVAASGTPTATVLLGNGDGTFTFAPSPATGRFSNSVAIGDFNGDGGNDLAIVNFSDNTVSVLLSQLTTTASGQASGISPMGTGTHQVAGIYCGDSGHQSSISSTLGLTALPVTPAITWANPAPIIYGTTLSAAQLNATASVSGTFVYAPALGTVLTVGTHSLQVTFKPTNATNYTTATATVPLTVNPATPTISWLAPASIPYGTTLSSAQLDASSAVSGTLVYSPAAGTTLTAGPHTLLVSLTPADTTNYTTAQASVPLTVSQAIPSITWTTPAAIPYGTALSAAQLNATSALPGTFQYAPAAGKFLAAGAQTLQATFTPADKTNYAIATATVTLTVNQAAQTVSFAPIPTTAAYGAQPLALTARATSGLPIVFGVTGPGTVSGSTLTIAGAGTIAVTANQPGNSNYSAATPVAQTIVVSKATPGAVLKLSASSVFLGSTVMLTASLSGGGAAPTGMVTFLAGTTPLGTAALANGAASLAVTPAALGKSTVTARYAGDNNYNAATFPTATFTVNPKLAAAIRLTAPSTSIAYETPLTLTATVSGAGTRPTGTVTFLNGTTQLGTGTLNGSGVATLTGALLLGGKSSLTASYAGDSQYTAAASAALVETVNPIKPAIELVSSASSVSYGTQVTLTATLTGSGAIPTGTVTFYAGSTSVGQIALNNGTATLMLTTLPGGKQSVTARYNGDNNYAAAVSKSVGITVNKAAQTITFAPLAPTLPYGAKPLTLSAVASSGLQVTFSATGPATVSGTTLTISGAGSVVVTASQGGNANYAPATPVSQTITVSKAAQTVALKRFDANGPDRTRPLADSEKHDGNR